MPEQNSYPTIRRSENNRVLGGVCGGLGEYFNIDPNIIRLIFILLTVFGGSGVLVYIILWIILPSESQIGSGKDHFKANLNDVKQKVREVAQDIRNSAKNAKGKPENRNLFAYIAILLGILFLLQNFGFGDLFNIGRLWPLILIALGLSIMLRKGQK